jgi:hypothetical protein
MGVDWGGLGGLGGAMGEMFAVMAAGGEIQN